MEIKLHFLIEKYKNPAAKYSATSNSKNLSVRVKWEYGRLYVYGSAKKAGKYIVSIKETYNKKTSTIGKINVQAHNIEFRNEVLVIGLGKTASAIDETVIQYYDFKEANYFEVEDNSLIQPYYDKQGDWCWKATKLGETVVTVYADESKTKLLGSYRVKVMEVHADIMDVEEKYETYVGAEDISLNDLYFTIEANDYSSFFITDPIEVVSDNPSIVSVHKNLEDEDEIYAWSMKPLAKGTANITITCGKLVSKCTITVYGSEDEYYTFN